MPASPAAATPARLSSVRRRYRRPARRPSCSGKTRIEPWCKAPVTRNRAVAVALDDLPALRDEQGQIHRLG